MRFGDGAATGNHGAATSAVGNHGAATSAVGSHGAATSARARTRARAHFSEALAGTTAATIARAT